MNDTESLRQEAESLKNQIRVRTDGSRVLLSRSKRTVSLFRMLEKQRAMLLYCKWHRMSTRLVGSKCAHDEHFVVTSPKSMLCIGVPMPGLSSVDTLQFDLYVRSFVPLAPRLEISSPLLKMVNSLCGIPTPQTR